MSTFIEYLSEWEPVEGSTTEEATRQVKRYKYDYRDCPTHGKDQPADYGGYDGGIICLHCQISEAYQLISDLTDNLVAANEKPIEVVTITTNRWQRQLQESAKLCQGLYWKEVLKEAEKPNLFVNYIKKAGEVIESEVVIKIKGDSENV